MPLYEYVCRSCGSRLEMMRKVSERLAGPSCSGCGQVMALSLSAPGRVGSAAGSAADASSWGESCAPGGCCGGGACGGHGPG